MSAQLFSCVLSIEWIPATIPNGVDIVDRDAAPPPPMAKAFVHLIESREFGMDQLEQEKWAKVKALGLRPKKKVIPSKKMKRLHWKKIEPERIPPTLWKDIDDEAVSFNKVEFELKFQFRSPRTTKPGGKCKQDRSGQIYSFVEPKVSGHIYIFYLFCTQFAICNVTNHNLFISLVDIYIE